MRAKKGRVNEGKRRRVRRKEGVGGKQDDERKGRKMRREVEKKE